MIALETNPKHRYFADGKCVYGIFLKPLPISNLPEGARVRIRMRANDFVKVIVKCDAEIMIYDIKQSDDGTSWELLPYPSAQNQWAA